MSAVFFTDRDLGKLFPAALRAAGLAVERHDEHFAPDATDPVWLKKVGERGWFALTRDRRIRYKPNEVEAVMQNGVGLFVLIGAVRHRDLAMNFVNSARLVQAFIEANPRPFIAKVFRPSTRDPKPDARDGGRVELWLSYSDWVKRPR